MSGYKKGLSGIQDTIKKFARLSQKKGRSIFIIVYTLSK
jgi:hypothetical protein